MNHTNTPTLKKQCGDLIHDLHTPLATIRTIDRMSKTILPELIRGYYLAVENGLIEEPINSDSIHYVEENIGISSRIVQETNVLLETFIDRIKNS